MPEDKVWKRDCKKSKNFLNNIGLKRGHALASLALTEQWFLLTTAHFASQSNFLRKLVCNRTTFLMKSLSLRILSEKLRFSCFSQVPTGSDYPEFRPILPKIFYILIFYSSFFLYKGALFKCKKVFPV